MPEVVVMGGKRYPGSQSSGTPPTPVLLPKLFGDYLWDSHKVLYFLLFSMSFYSYFLILHVASAFTLLYLRECHLLYNLIIITLEIS